MPADSLAGIVEVRNLGHDQFSVRRVEGVRPWDRTSEVVLTRILTCNSTYNSKCMKTKSLRISPEARRVAGTGPRTKTARGLRGGRSRPSA
jgi:hypothetical protein